MARAKHASKRRRLLESLNDAKKTVDLLRGWWDVRGTVYIPAAERAPGDNVYQRERLAHEYPEVQAQYWGATYEKLDLLIKDLTALRETAAAEYFVALEANQTERTTA